MLADEGRLINRRMDVWESLAIISMVVAYILYSTDCGRSCATDALRWPSKPFHCAVTESHTDTVTRTLAKQKHACMRTL